MTCDIWMPLPVFERLAGADRVVAVTVELVGNG